MKLDELYQDLILDHFKNPRCRGTVTDPDAAFVVYNPLCGDEVALTVKSPKTELEELGCTGHGCAISQASASLMAEKCRGLSREDAKELCTAFRALMKGEHSEAQSKLLGDVLALEGIRRFPARIKCATLAWEALEQCINQLPKNND